MRFLRLLCAVIVICVVAAVFLQLTRFSPFVFADKLPYQPLLRLAYPEFYRLQARISSNVEELKELATFTLPPTGGTSGHMLRFYYEPGECWVQCNWNSSRRIDAIALFPVQRSDVVNRMQFYGLPEKIDLVFLRAGLEVARRNIVVDRQQQANGVLPIYIEFPSIEVDAMRLENANSSQEPRQFGIAELFVFEGQQNIAPLAELDASYEFVGVSGYALDFIVDDQTPVGLPQKQMPHPNLGYKISAKLLAETQVELEYTWDRAQWLDELRLYPTSRMLGVKEPDAGFPMRFLVQGRSTMTAGWENLHQMSEYQLARPGLNPVSVRFPARRLQAIRLVALELWKPVDSAAQLTLSEMQARYKGVTVGPKEVRASEVAANSEGLPFEQMRRFWSLSALYDGLSTEGQLQGERTWAKELSRRSDIRLEQSQLMLELERTAILANRLCWRFTLWVPLCVFSLMIAGFVNTYIRHRQQVRRVRDQLAADLHDDLGSNLSAIAAYLSQLRRRLLKIEGEEILPLELPFLERLTRECLGSLKEMVSVTAPQITKHVPLVNRLRDVADIHRAGLALQFEVSPECEHWEIQEAKRRSLNLFLREALNNIIRHSGASLIRIRLRQEADGRYWLRICDDGCGLSEETLQAFRDESTLSFRVNELEADFEVRNLSSGGLEVAVAMPQGAAV